ncbi:U1 small nuclear ribonucleoprotein C [Mus pahari]|uniref:U1 small nuclear ribonucleoprotein C n=1 Tax=Mus pahari TaxID=10093 RepID=UPI0011148AC4|nr:U1 small nuclear ribonucleoprotein C [Mus pahari]
MPKFYCDYCDTYLTHDSPSVRKTHCSGRKHKENVKDYYQKWMEEQAQSLIDKTTAAFQQGKIPPAPFSAPPPAGAMIPPPPSLPGPPRPGMMPAPHMGGPPMMPMMGPPPPGMMPVGPASARVSPASERVSPAPRRCPAPYASEPTPSRPSSVRLCRGARLRPSPCALATGIPEGGVRSGLCSAGSCGAARVGGNAAELRALS